MSLTRRQQRVIALMEQGWALGKSEGAHPRFWLQRGGLGRGGESERVLLGTAMSLLKRGLIEETEHSYPTSRYTLLARASQEAQPA